METPLLEIRDVKKYFPVKKVHGKEITVKAVDSINLKINQGEIVGLVGESGCGKSTLGKSILKLHEITGGQILFHGEDITNYNERQMRPLREKIQIIFQDPYASLNPKKKIVQSVMAPLDVAGKYTKEEKLEKVRKILREVGLSDKYLEKYPHEMSGGQRQRVVIACIWGASWNMQERGSFMGNLFTRIQKHCCQRFRFRISTRSGMR